MSFIVVGYYQFPIDDPYVEGHVMTAEEASILSWYRARLIQRSASKWIQDIIDSSENDILAPDELADLTHKVSEYSSSYRLEFKKEPRSSILEYYLDQIAKGILLRAGQFDPKKEDLERVKKTPEVQSRARDRVRSGTFSLAELFQ